jgi:chromosome segregation ATPase
VGVAADGEGTAMTLADQLMDRKREVLQYDTEAKSYASRVTHTEKELKKSQAQLKKEDGDYKSLKQQEETLQRELEKLKKTLPKNFSQEKFDSLVVQKKEVAAKIKELENTIHNKRARLQSANVEYKSPSAKFDRTKVCFNAFSSTAFLFNFDSILFSIINLLFIYFIFILIYVYVYLFILCFSSVQFLLDS